MRSLFIAALVACAALPTPVRAGDICDESSIKMIVPYSAGTSVDIATRAMAKSMSEILAQPIGVINMPGAAGQIGAQYLATSAPDGCTLGSFNNSPLTMRGVKMLRENPNYDPAQEFTIIGRTYEVSFVLAVNKQSKIGTFNDLLTRANAQPGEVKLSVSWMLGDATLFLMRSHYGANFASIPYRKGDVTAVPDIAADRIQGGIMTIGVALPRIQSGELQPVFVYAKKRIPQLPDTPTVKELGFTELDSVSSWQGLIAPRGLPPEKVKRLNEVLHEAFAQQETVRALATLVMRPDPSTPEELQQQIREQLKLWDNLAKQGAVVID